MGRATGLNGLSAGLSAGRKVKRPDSGREAGVDRAAVNARLLMRGYACSVGFDTAVLSPRRPFARAQWRMTGWCIKLSN